MSDLINREEANTIFGNGGRYDFSDMDHLYRVIRGVAAHGMSECDFQFKNKRTLNSAVKRLNKLGYSLWVKEDKLLNIDWC